MVILKQRKNVYSLKAVDSEVRTITAVKRHLCGTYCVRIECIKQTMEIEMSLINNIEKNNYCGMDIRQELTLATTKGLQVETTNIKRK